MPTFLHVGCGESRKDKTTRGFNSAEWTELRLDIEPDVQPDILCSMTDMSPVADGAVDAVFSSHNIEHLYWHEVPLALGEFHRVLKPTGFLVVTCPDLQAIGERLAEGKLLEAAYESVSGPIAPIDMLYGFRPSLEQGFHSMGHKCGFTQPALQKLLQQAGFRSWAFLRRPKLYDLFAIGAKSALPDDELRALAHAHFPVRTPAQNEEQRA